MEAGLSEEQIKAYWALAFGRAKSECGLLPELAPEFAPDAFPYSAMSRKDLDKARAGYANFDGGKESPILLAHGRGWFSGAESGLLMTGRHVFGRKKSNRTVFETCDIKSIAVVDGGLTINGFPVCDLYCQDFIVDFISRFCGLITGDFRAAVLRILASNRLGELRLDQLLAGEAVADVFHRKSLALDQNKSHLRADQSVAISDSQLIHYDKDRRRFAEDERIRSFKKSEFPNIRVQRRIEHPHQHSHTGHAVAHLLKHASLINIISAAVSAGMDASNYFSPPHGKAVFDIYVERSKLTVYSDFEEIFQKMSEGEARSVATMFEESGYRVEYTDDSPFTVMSNVSKLATPCN